MKTAENKKIKILLVDDEPGIRNVLKITLEASGYAICLASDGETGLSVFKKENPGIVITDIKMPGIDGIELLKRIKAIKPDTEVIMITGHGDMALAIKSLKYEAADFINKPIDSAVLESAIQKAQDRIRISRDIKQYMDDLENLVEEKDKKLNESETLVTIGMTIAGMSHAIKNIAGGLKGSSFVLEQGIEQENREVLTQGWEMMKGNINKITKLSLDLLNYAKTTKLDFKLENPNTPAREVKQLLNHRAVEKSIDFVFTPCREKKLVLMDCEAIHNCILTLVTNAIDAFDTPALDTDGPRQVTLAVTLETDHIAYTVQDTGCGVNETVKSSLFNDFITTKGINGTGFGLMTTKKIVTEHNGEICFIPGENTGSRFEIKLPIDPSAQARMIQ